MTFIYCQKRLGDFISNTKTTFFIYYRTTGGRYWKIITNFQPQFFKNGIRTRSSRESYIYFLTEEFKELALAIYNSSLFCWFYTINSNGRDLNPYDLSALPIDFEKINKTSKRKLRKLVCRLMIDLKKNSRFEIRFDENTSVKYQIISPRKSSI